MTPVDDVEAERWERIILATLDRLDALRLSDELDVSFYEALHESLIIAGATEFEIDSVTALLIMGAVENTEPGSEERATQFELITDHLARTKVRISLNRADTVLKTEFPDRPRQTLAFKSR